ncbi:biotin--[acetyl-CoA-carboxylase] ligase [Brachybacterium sp. AOP43-C2-M15]|uniref:biotin--[acetyl-CoA-carboxylase] ligase n=1 Tax=Brachybacterium sp. AOP43-C2-M15 TaxID=3457661 RepID=UPI0040335519
MDQAGTAREPDAVTGISPGDPATADAAARIHRLGTIASTQDEATRLLAAGEVPPFAVTARRQTAGRGRLGRTFSSPEGSSLALTAVHRTALPPDRRGWFPLAAGLAAVTALEELFGQEPGRGTRIGLKWPNDLHAEDGRKLGGILAEARGRDLVLLGIGMNLRAPVGEDDGEVVPGAAWLRGEGGLRSTANAPDGRALRERLEGALHAALREELGRLESAQGDGVSAGTHGRYTMTCLTLGQAVRVDPLGETGAGGVHPPSLHGIARTIDGHGRLVVDLEGGDRTAVDVGDVRHLRPDGASGPTTHEATDVEEERGT